MSFNCNCNYTSSIVGAVVQCKGGCSNNSSNTAPETEQKRIWNGVRVASSLYTMNIGALNIAGSAKNLSLAASNPGKVNWNQSSDRAVAGIQTAYHPTRGNTLKTTVTSGRPGAGAPAGKGVDVKHGSYARYLGQKRAANIRTERKNTIMPPLFGNKTQAYGLVANSFWCCPLQTVLAEG